MEQSGNIQQKDAKNLKGLAVTTEDLIAEQKYLPYLSLKGNYVTSMNAGNVKSAFKGRGLEFEEVRAYMFGDDVRDIDWRVTARKLAPYTKVFSEEKDREITILLDLSATMVFGTRRELKSVTACRVAALLGWLTLHNKDRFGILIYDGKHKLYVKPQSNPQSLMYIFNKIAQTSQNILKKSYAGDISEAIDLLEYHQKGRNTIFIISDFFNYNKAKSEKIAMLAKKNKLYCINIFDVVEEVAPSGGVYAAQYDNRKVVFNSGVPDFRTSYHRYFKENREKIKKNCQKFLCKYIEIRTDVPFFKQLRLS